VPDRPPAFFIADSLGLDFLNSIATPVDATIDWLDSGEGLVAWVAQANLVPQRALNDLTKRAAPGALDKVASQARSLREWFRGFVRGHMGRPLTPDAIRELKPLNDILEHDEIFRRVAPVRDGGGDRLELQTLRLWRSPGSLLPPIGEALARCVCDEDFTAIKACEGQNCTLVFADRTRRRGRRWCSMATCGNRAKQAAHRDRLKNGR
jgi:predicted RNA-binding Zn ribbon-like protein